MDSVIIEFAKRIVSMEKAQGNLDKCFPHEVTYYSASNYLDRMDKASLEIASKHEHADKTIVLWWGFDGLRVNQDGTMEWISRGKETAPNQKWISGTRIKPTTPIIQSFLGTPLIYNSKNAQYDIQKICLMYAIEEIPGSRPEKEYTYIPGVLTFQNVSDLIEQTTLGDFGHRVYTKAFNNQLDFTVNLNSKFSDVWCEFVNVYYPKKEPDGKAVWFAVVPPWDCQSIYFRGTPSLVEYNTVNADMEATLRILVNGNIIKSERPNCIDVY